MTIPSTPTTNSEELQMGHVPHDIMKNKIARMYDEYVEALGAEGLTREEIGRKLLVGGMIFLDLWHHDIDGVHDGNVWADNNFKSAVDALTNRKP